MSNTTTVIYGPYGWLIGDQSALTTACECGVCQHGTTSADEDKRKVTLVFRREALLYDVENIAYTIGDTLKTDDAHERHQIQDIGQDGNVDRATRILDLVHAGCVEALYPYTKTECEDGMSLDDAFAEAQLYTITLNVPKKFSASTAKFLEQLIHEYMVCAVLADWLTITHADLAEMWQGKAQAALDKAKEIIREARTGITTRPMRPW